MDGSVYFSLGLYVAGLWFVSTHLISLLLMLIDISAKFVNESDRMYPAEWVIAPAYYSPLMVIGYIFFDEEDPGVSSYGALFGFTLMGLMVSVFMAAIWPVALIGVVYMGILLLLRSIARTGKKVAKIGKVAHTHPNSVEFTKEEI